MPRLLLPILALSAALLCCSLATARPLAEVSRTTVTTTETSASAASKPSTPPPAPEHSGSGPTTPAADPPTSAAASGKIPEDEPASAPEAPSQGNHRHHRPVDKSVAGGEVILGGLVTAIFAAVFCYIRVTRKKSQEEEEPVKA